MKKKDLKPAKRAAALRYDTGRESAPRMVAKGRGLVAERILELAREHDIPIREDRALIEVLSALELNEEIPPDLFKAVAEMLAFIYHVHGKRLEKKA